MSVVEPQMPDPKPHIVLFSGGTACRTINIALCSQPVELTRIVPAWDSGGSSKVLRETFLMLPVGDVRQALMTMAHGEGQAGDMVKICNARLSDQLGQAELRTEFDYFADGRHPLLQRMAPEIREAILNYLGLFKSQLSPAFDFRTGSIGNFILTGAYLAHGRNINRAITMFRKLCSISGDVWPVSTQDDVQLSATLRNGAHLGRQHLITRMNDEESLAGIAELSLNAGHRTASVEANEAALEAVASADAVVFGPGSFYTSILPHLLVGNIAEAIAANERAPKIFIGNILECAETRGMTLEDQLQAFIDHAKRQSQGKLRLTHLLANRELFPFEKTVGKFPYLKHGRLADICKANAIEAVDGDFEDAWTRGQHDGEAASAALLEVLHASVGRKIRA